MGRRYVVFLLNLFLLLVSLGFVGSSQAQMEAPPNVSPWKIIRQKSFPNYKVEIEQRFTLGKWPRIESTRARIIPQSGGSVTEVNAVLLTPDPKDYVRDWKGGLLDMDGDSLEDLVLRTSTGGAHCCYTYVIYSLSKPLKKLGEIDMQDCGEKIRLADLNGDGRPEIISCDSRFVYLGNLPYSESPFPPAVWFLGPSGYERADAQFPAVLQTDIAEQQHILKQGDRTSAVLQLVVDYLLLGRPEEAWGVFEKDYQGADKEMIKEQLMQRLGQKEIGESLPAGQPSASVLPAPSGALQGWGRP